MRNSQKKLQLESLSENNFEQICNNYKTEPILVKLKIKELPIMGRVTYKSLFEFSANM